MSKSKFRTTNESSEIYSENCFLTHFKLMLHSCRNQSIDFHKIHLTGFYLNVTLTRNGLSYTIHEAQGFSHTTDIARKILQIAFTREISLNKDT